VRQSSIRRLLGPAVFAALLLAGCGGGPDPVGRHGSTPSTAAPSKAYTVEQLAAAVGCTPRLAGRAGDVRQAECTVGGDHFVFLQFDEASGQRDWLAYATLYGGRYLAGDRWVLSGRSKEYLQELQKTLGGHIEENAGS
jgi:hypothetical protein